MKRLAESELVHVQGGEPEPNPWIVTKQPLPWNTILPGLPGSPVLPTVIAAPTPRG